MIEISGHSDDVVCIGGDVNDEVAPGAILLVGTKQAGVEVKMQYLSTGVWAARVSQVDDGAPIPWPVSICESEPTGLKDNRTPPYTVVVRIDCPPGTPVYRGSLRLGVAKKKRGT
jgi:hypothetical protein